MAFYFKKHGRDVYALCDKQLIGKILREGDKVLDLDVYRSFYLGELREKLEYLDIKDFTSINAVGEESIKQLLKLKLLKKEELKYINGIPYVIIVKIRY